MKEIIKNSLKNSYSYSEYVNFVNQIVENQDETRKDTMEYIVLNAQRIKRLDKTLKINPEDIQKISAIKNKLLWIVITEPWCGDAAQIVPMINKMAEISQNIELKLVLRDQNLPLMDEFLTSGARAIPKLIIVNPENFEVLASWGARPETATQLVQQCKEKYGAFTTECKEELQKWYNKDKGQSIVNEIVTLLENKL